jgi:hypothetical protein
MVGDAIILKNMKEAKTLFYKEICVGFFVCVYNLIVSNVLVRFD